MKKLTPQEEKEAARALLADIERLAAGRHLRYMEVCGTHTVAIFRAGLRQILPENIELVSGPGCPVCVTSDAYMDKAIACAKMEDVIVATFGDMLKVPGSRESLSDARAAGADIRVVYSPLDALAASRENPERTVVFLGVGFETTAPTEAAAVLSAKEEGLKNFCVLSAQKLVPPAVKLLLADPDVHVDGFLLPGHACVVTGTRPYAFLADEAHKPGVVAGFTPLAILRAVWRLVRQTAANEARIENEYGSVVREEGNPAARASTRRRRTSGAASASSSARGFACARSSPRSMPTCACPSKSSAWRRRRRAAAARFCAARCARRTARSSRRRACRRTP